EKEVERYLAEKIKAEEEFYTSQGKPVPASVYNQKLDPNIEKGISVNMRAAKADFTQKEMVERWETEWDEKGFTHEKLEQIIERGKALDPKDRFEKAPSAEQLMELLIAKKQSFKQKEFRDLYLQHHAGTGKSFEQLKEEINVALAEHGVELNPEKSKGRQLQGDDFNRVFTSKKLHNAEKSALAWVKENKDRQSKVAITVKEATKGISEWERLKSEELGFPVKLNSEQRKAAIAMCTGKGVACAISGEAGTGKTFAIQAATHCLSKKGLTQVGAAVSGRAAENLSTEGLGGAKANSVAAFLKRYALESSKGEKVAIPQILWLDEAATTNSAQLSEILKIGQRANADFRVICTYDFKQTQAIGPTGLLLDIVKEVGQQELTEVKRQKTAEALAVAKLARDGNLTELKEHMKSQVRFDGEASWYSVKNSRAEQIAELTDIYMKNTNKATDKLIVGLLRRDIEDLNQSIREAKIAAGEIQVGRKVLCSYKDEDSTLAIAHTTRQEKVRYFSEGDRVIIKEGFKVAVGKDENGRPIKEHLLTGYAGTIIEQNPNDAFMKVRFDNGKVVAWDFSKDKQNSVDHFYAGTVNSTQGASVKLCAGMDAEFGTAAKTASLSNEEKRELEELGKNRNLLYTLLSRHGDEANFITTKALDATFEQRFGAFGLEESTLGKVKETPIVDEGWGLIDITKPQQEVQPASLTKEIKHEFDYYEQQVSGIPPAHFQGRVLDLSARDLVLDPRRDVMSLRQDLSDRVEQREAEPDHSVLSTVRSTSETEPAKTVMKDMPQMRKTEAVKADPNDTRTPPKMGPKSLQDIKLEKARTKERQVAWRAELFEEMRTVVQENPSIADLHISNLLCDDGWRIEPGIFNTPLKDGDLLLKKAIQANMPLAAEAMVRMGAYVPEDLWLEIPNDSFIEKMIERGMNNRVIDPIDPATGKVIDDGREIKIDGGSGSAGGTGGASETPGSTTEKPKQEHALPVLQVIQLTDPSLSIKLGRSRV
ncbi:MAG TPA: AAA family ATPase, partial [Patescibacteria group bacterium]|nr:AAA family ATPase [Patescibacteria group bacterium]